MTIRPIPSELSERRLFDQLCIDEGVVREVYEDHLGYRTFGVGHLVLHTDPEYGQDVGTPVSDDRVWEAFQHDLKTCIEECERLYLSDWNNFPAEVKEIIANMMFKMRRPRLSQFRNMNKHLSAGDWKSAAIEGRDSRWYDQVTNRAERLMERLEQV